MFGLAIKNIFFYKARSITTLLLVIMTTGLFVVFESLLNGSHDNMLRNSLGVYTGAAQIMNKEYHNDKTYDYLISDLNSTESKLEAVGVVRYSSRLESMGLLAMGNKSRGSMVTGVNPSKEKTVSRIAGALIEGRWLDDSDTNKIYIGSGVRDKLGVEVGEVVAFIGSDVDYGFVADKFQVVGVFKTGLYEFDGIASFINKKYFDTLMESEGLASYIAVWPSELDTVEVWVDEWNNGEGLQAYSWRTLMSGLVEAMEVDSVFAYIEISILFVINFFVIMVFGFLNISSRTKDIGALRALGASKGSVRLLLIYEGMLIAIVSVIIGGLVGSAVSYYYEINPIVIEGMSETFKEYGVISDSIPMKLDWIRVVWNMTLMLGINFLAVIFPIRWINKLTPLEAMHYV